MAFNIHRIPYLSGMKRFSDGDRKFYITGIGISLILKLTTRKDLNCLNRCAPEFLGEHPHDGMPDQLSDFAGQHAEVELELRIVGCGPARSLVLLGVVLAPRGPSLQPD